ncbi:MAG: hypothetical protein WBH86_07375, partial [Thermogutta sp.]
MSSTKIVFGASVNFTRAAMWLSVLVMTWGVLGSSVYAQRQMDKLNRGLVAVQAGPGEVYVSWRLLKDDPKDLAFNVYRQAAGTAQAIRLNDRPISKTCDFTDRGVSR